MVLIIECKIRQASRMLRKPATAPKFKREDLVCKQFQWVDIISAKKNDWTDQTTFPSSPTM